jgi:hypothetical protein
MYVAMLDVEALIYCFILIVELSCDPIFPALMIDPWTLIPILS